MSKEIIIQVQTIKIDNSCEDLLVALVEGELMGSVRLERYAKRSADIFMMYVSRWYRKQGVARKLLEACCNLAEDKGCPSIGMCVSKENKDAIACYEKCGFKFIHEYDDGQYLMSKEL